MPECSSKNNPDILVVDDEVMMLEILTDLLHEEGYNISTAENGRQALEKINDSSHFDIVLSDLYMPEMGGMELLINVRQGGNEIPFIVLTASNDLSTAMKAIKLGAWDYLIKDESIPDTLILTISQTLKKQKLIEEKRHVEEQIRKKNIELLDLNEQKNKFLGIASHDLRNPLYLIRSYSEIMIDGSLGSVNEKQKNLLEKIFRSSDYMRALLDNLLDISKIESGKIELDKKVQDFNETTQKQMELNQLLAHKKQIKLHLKMEEIPLFAFDNNAVVQSMGNFIGNAIKFSPAKTNIYVSTENKENRVQFSVRDEGPGISQKDQKLLFGEFQTLSAKPTGGEKTTGLGLAIVKKLIILHEGEIGVSSELGKGSTFFFTLPL